MAEPGARTHMKQKLASTAWARLACATACWAIGTAAAAADPFDTPACHQAMDVVKAREVQALRARAAAASAPEDGAWRVAQAQLQAARESAARICLGASDATPLPQPRARDPVAVPPVSQPRSLPQRPPPVVAPPAPLISPPPAAGPVTVVACDPSACWASDGSRLERAGATLIGPRGVCTLQGVQLRCP